MSVASLIACIRALGEEGGRLSKWQSLKLSLSFRSIVECLSGAVHSPVAFV